MCLSHIGVADDAPIKPKGLKPGDTVALVAPARAGNEEKLATIAQGFQKMGLKIKISDNMLHHYGYLGGSDEERAAGVMAAWRDPEVDAIFCITGGYGTTRMIDLLDYDYIREHPKIMTGFSDITGIHLAVYKKTNMIVYHSPTTSQVYSGDFETRPFAASSFWNTVMPSNPAGTGKAAKMPIVYTSDGLTTPIITIAGGKAKGRLIGGNLSLVQALMGTPYEADLRGKILFIEDVGEQPYRLDRMLSQLRLAGKLDEVAGVICGLFDRCEAEDVEESFTVDDLIQQYFADKPYPVIAHFPVGHVIENATLPIGLMVELDADNRTVTFLESPVTE